MYKFIARFFWVFLATATSTFSTELDPLLIADHSMYSASVKALGDAGIAYPNDILCGLQNPALIYSFFEQGKASNASIAAGYGRDSLFDNSIIPAGVAFKNKSGAMGFFYRGLFAEQSKMQNEAILNFSGMLSGSSVDGKGNTEMGQVDFGVNIRYEWFVWKKRPLGGIDLLELIDNGVLRQKRLLLDIGLYQSNVSNNLDFAMTMQNLLGYIWTEENPVVRDSTVVTYLTSGDSVISHVPYYYRADVTSKGWIKNEYKALTFGIVYHINPGSVSWVVDLPIDFEMLGLFNKKVKNQYIFKGGIAATIQNHFSFRLGYSRTPGPIRSGWKEIKGMNVFTGGAGISIDPVTLDLYLSDEVFGTSVSCDF